MTQTARMYGVFNPRGKLVAAFDSYKLADALAAYKWDALKDAAYWSVAPQPPTISHVEFEYEPPEDRHKITDEPIENCSCFGCPRHSRNIWSA